LKELEARYKKS